VGTGASSSSLATVAPSASAALGLACRFGLAALGLGAVVDG